MPNSKVKNPDEMRHFIFLKTYQYQDTGILFIFSGDAMTYSILH